MVSDADLRAVYSHLSPTEKSYVDKRIADAKAGGAPMAGISAEEKAAIPEVIRRGGGGPNWWLWAGAAMLGMWVLWK
jgi:hypothetical protein